MVAAAAVAVATATAVAAAAAVAAMGWVFSWQLWLGTGGTYASSDEERLLCEHSVLLHELGEVEETGRC